MFIAGALLCGCDKEERGEESGMFQPEVGKVIDVVLNTTTVPTTKVSYTANEDYSTFAFSWHEGDEVSLIVLNTTGNDNQKFTAAETSGTAPLSGQIATWDGSNTVFAIYPYSNVGYTVSDSNTIVYLSSQQSIDASADNNFTNALLVASSSNATATSEDDYNIPTLEFKQAMAFYQLKLVDIPSDEVLSEIGFSCDSEVFTTYANIDLSTAVANSVVKSSTISSTIYNSTEATATINFAIIPVDLTNIPVTIYVKTSGGETNKSYIKHYDSGVNFERNSIVYSSEGVLSLISDFESETTDEVALADISSTSYPSGDTWVITDKSASKVDFTGLISALTAAYSQSSSRRITLEFPNLESFPIESLYGCKAITAVYAPVATSIGDSAFYGCTNLASISFPIATSIGASTFRGCTTLSELSLPLLTSIGTYGFYSCTNIETLSLPVVKTIGTYAFRSCSSISTVELPLVESLGSYSFYGCTNITTLSLPSAITVSSSAFYSCSSLISVSLPLVTSIGSDSFCNCSNLLSVSMPSVITVGSSSLRGCSKLTSISLPKATTINNNAFYSCTSLTTASIPLATVVNYSAFYSCSSLTSIVAPLAVTIGSNCFYGCSKLTSISLSSATTIEYYAFRGCISLSDVSMPKARTLGNYTFYECDALVSLELATNEDTVLDSLGSYIFEINGTTNHQGNVTLTIGSQNSSMIESNKLTVGSVSYTFKKIIINGGTVSSIVTSGESATGKAW